MSLTLSKSLLFFLFIFSPLAFGTTEPWSYAIMETCAAIALLCFFIHTHRHQDTIYRVPGLLPLLLFLSYILFQTIPQPGFIVQLLSPNSYEIHMATREIIGSESWMPLTIHPKATLSEFFRYSTYAVYYILTVQLLSRKKTFQASVFAITFFGTLLAFSSILQFYITEDMALWFRHSPRNSIVMGPYVNHNHYAGLMEMIFPISLGLFLFYRPRIKNTSLIKGIAEIFKQEKANIHILIGSGVLIIIVSIFVSLSRGAMISSCMALVLFTFLLVKRKISKGNTTLLISIIMLCALSIGWFGWDQIFDRFVQLKKAHGVIYESRLTFWKDTKEIIQHYPVTGSGMGTYVHVYPSHRTYDSRNNTILTHAHNDYLELLAEGGIIAFLLAGCFFASFFYKTYTVFSRRRDAFSIYLYMGCITGIVSILFHSMTDFNMHIGANGLWFFFITGIAVCAANTGIRRKNLITRLEPVKSELKQKAAFAGVCIFTFAVIFFNVSNLGGIFYFSNINHYIISKDSDPKLVQGVKKIAGLAAALDPLTSEYALMQADTTWLLGDTDSARQYYITSLKLDPLNSRHLKRFARFSARTGNKDKAEAAFQLSMAYAGNNAEYTFEYAIWCLAHQKFDIGLKHMNKALTLDTNFMERALTAMIIYNLDMDQIQEAIPETPDANINFARFLFKTGRSQAAVERYKETIVMVENQSFPKSMTAQNIDNKLLGQFFKIYWFFLEQKDFMNAMEVMTRAEKLLPQKAKIQVAIGDLYNRQGITYKAVERYDYALMLDPENKRAQKMLKKLRNGN